MRLAQRFRQKGVLGTRFRIICKRRLAARNRAFWGYASVPGDMQRRLISFKTNMSLLSPRTRVLLYGFAAWCISGLGFGAPNSVNVLIVDGESEERLYSVVRDGYEDVLARLPSAVKVATTRYERSQREGLARMRSGAYELIIGPSHIVAHAKKAGYEVVATSGQMKSTVFVVSAATKATNLGELRGLRLCTSDEDSLTTYQAKSALSASKLDAAKFFSSVRYSRRDSLALFGISATAGKCDVAAVDANYFKSVQSDPLYANLRTVAATSAVPAIAVATKVATAAVGAAVIGARVETSQLAKGTFASIAMLLEYINITPFSLPGVQVVSADEVVQLARAGGVVVDTRSRDEFVAARIQGAVHLPYVEKSEKRVDADLSADAIQLSSVPTDKTVIFACNGSECWKSLKACKTAVAQGYNKVFWFRGGLPEWKQKQLPTEAG